MKKREKRKKSIFLKLAVFCFVAYVAFSLVQTQMRIMEKKQELQYIKNQCEEQTLQNQELENVLSTGSELDHIERIAREKLGYAYPDERVYVDTSGS